MKNIKKISSIKSYDLAIVGAGLAGLSLAVLLGKQGIKIVIIDSAPESVYVAPAPSARTVALMQTSLNILQETGALIPCLPFSAPLETMRIIDDSLPGDETIEAEFDACDIGLKRFSMNIPNNALRTALYNEVKKLKNVDLLCETKLEDYEVAGSHVAVTLDNKNQISCKLLIGADGRESLVRKIAGIGRRKKEYDQTAITCVINHALSHNNTATEFHRSAGPLALVPLPGNQSSIVWVETRNRAQDIMALSKDAFIQTLQDATNDALGAITLDLGPECWPLCTIKSKKLTAQRVALIAESAHVMSPITAQGLNLSLRDVAALAETLIDAFRLGLDPGSKTILDRYESRRKIDIETRVMGVNRMNKFVSTDFFPLQKLRRRGLKIVDRITPLRHFAMQHGLAPQLDQGRLMRGEAL